MYRRELRPLTPAELRSVGQSLYGPAWRAELARALAVGEDEIIRVEVGRLPAPPEWRGKLVLIAQDIAHRAMETASGLLCPESEADCVSLAPQSIRLA
jgi:hypothetical protein